MAEWLENNWFSQFLANIINVKTERPKVLETTALGVALFAGYQIGVFKSLGFISVSRNIIHFMMFPILEMFSY